MVGPSAFFTSTPHFKGAIYFSELSVGTEGSGIYLRVLTPYSWMRGQICMDGHQFFNPCIGQPVACGGVCVPKQGPVVL